MRVIIALLVLVSFQFAYGEAKDPGVRGGPAGAGGPLPGLSPADMQLFSDVQSQFNELQSVKGDVDGGVPDSGKGLGPTFNSDSCLSCHAQPASGGTSPAVNPQVAVATKQGATNTVPFFVTLNGPVREVRFKLQRDANGNLIAKRDGGVHGIFTIAGRTDAPGCTVAQPDFATEGADGNLSFRIPTPLFGAGLIESIPDQAILDSFNATAAQRAAFRIGGHPNHSGNDGTITKFGWKAQNKSLLIFAGEAYNVEMGVTNEVFPNERAGFAGCVFNPTPEDVSHPEKTGTDSLSDVGQFAVFMRLLAPPTPAAPTASTQNGSQLFNTIGCALCHTPQLPVANSAIAAINQQQNAALFSDLMLHHMGRRLADQVVQGEAGPDEFRTSPLWGLGQRLFFLHDGRTSDLTQAIILHYSPRSYRFPRSEANGTVLQFVGLSDAQKQDLLNFLRSL